LLVESRLSLLTRNPAIVLTAARNKLRCYAARLRHEGVLELADPHLRPRFLVNTSVEAEKVVYHDNETASLERFLSAIRPGDVVYDVGANIGLYTVPAAIRAGEGGLVHAFEPVPLWRERLRANARLNRLDNVITHDVGLADRAGEFELVMKDTQGSGMGSISPSYRAEVDPARRKVLAVQLVRGEDYAIEHGLGAPNVVKIDVEGAELAVIDGLAGLLGRDDCRFVLCEVHPKWLDAPVEDVGRRLEALGFGIETIGQRRSEHHIVARRRPA
jgi:FkbM family methyltransferase